MNFSDFSETDVSGRSSAPLSFSPVFGPVENCLASVLLTRFGVIKAKHSAPPPQLIPLKIGVFGIGIVFIFFTLLKVFVNNLSLSIFLKQMVFCS